MKYGKLPRDVQNPISQVYRHHVVSFMKYWTDDVKQKQRVFVVEKGRKKRNQRDKGILRENK